MFEVCFEKQNVRIGRSRWLFATRRRDRFEWIALLALERVEKRSDVGWVATDEIAGLPSWRGKTRHHIGTNVGRYLQAFERAEFEPVIAQNRWAGPYRLGIGSAVSFDVPIAEVRKRLGVAPETPSLTQKELYRFAFSYARAQWLYFQGRLAPSGGGHAAGESAYEHFMRMAEDPGFNPRLRLIACLAAIRVLFRLGRFQAARKTLEAKARLLASIDDTVLKAHYHLALAWTHQRGASGTRSNRATERALGMASKYAETSGDRASMGLLAHRRSGFLTKKGRHEESIAQLLYAIEAALLIGNFDHVQAHCGDIGSVVHRLGPRFYEEAREWLLLGIAIARWMNIGLEDAHGEMILGKIYAEIGKRPRLARFWLQRAEGMALKSGNKLNLADVKMVWAFWHQRFGSRKDQIKALAEALLIFRGLRQFDCRQKERYMARKFPSLWPEVMKLAESACSSTAVAERLV
jgi:hypothetical protein